MTVSTRRSVLKQLVAAPWLAYLGAGRAAAASTVTVREAATAGEHRRLGIQLMRFLNTAQLWNVLESEAYVGTDQLEDSPGVRRMRASEKLESTGLGETFIRGIGFGRASIAPGWEFHLVVASSGNTYLATLTNTSEFQVSNLATDNKGVIFKITELPVRPAAFTGRAKDLTRAVPIGEPDPMSTRAANGRSGRLMKAALLVGALGGAPNYDICWSCGGCCSCVETCCWPCCACECQGSVVPGNQCSNCGCSTCTWVCCPSGACV